MKKKFASFLITGKAATLPFFMNNSVADTNLADMLFDSSQPQLMERAGQGIAVTGDTVQIVSPGPGCSFPQPTDIMNVVVTGVRNGDFVFIASADNKDDPNFIAVNPAFRIGQQNLRILTSFYVDRLELSPLSGFEHGGGDLGNAVSAISVPVDLNQISSTGLFYMQALILRPNPLTAELPATMVFSELDEIKQVTATCDSYGIHY